MVCRFHQEWEEIRVLKARHFIDFTNTWKSNNFQRPDSVNFTKNWGTILTPALCIQETCEWGCKHFRCGKQCGKKCGRKPCDQPCTKKLKCGHDCVGFCGDPCPPLCRVCDLEELTEFFQLGKVDEARWDNGKEKSKWSIEKSRTKGTFAGKNAWVTIFDGL